MNQEQKRTDAPGEIRQQIERKHGSQITESGRQQSDAEHGRSALIADDRGGGRIVKPLRRGMHHGRIEGRKRKSDQAERGRRQKREIGEQKHGAGQPQQRAEPDLPGVSQAVRNESEQEAPESQHPPVSGDRISGRFGRISPALSQEQISPQSQRILRAAVEEHHERAAEKTQAVTDLPLERLRPAAASARSGLLPEIQGHQKQSGEAQLHGGDDAVAATPAPPGGENERDHQRTGAGPDSPAAVKPVHVPARVVPGDKVVHAGVDRPLPEAERNGEQQQNPEKRGKRIAEQSAAGHETADHQQFPGPQAAQDRAAEKGGNGRTERQKRRDESRIIDRNSEFRPHGVPGDAEDIVRQPETDEADVDDDEKRKPFISEKHDCRPAAPPAFLSGTYHTTTLR